jgi:hypothetical protein
VRSDTDIDEQWSRWLLARGEVLDDVPDAVVPTLIEHLTHGRASLEHVCCGAWFDVISSCVVREEAGEAEADRQRQKGHLVRIEPIAGHRPGVACVDVVALRPALNLFQVCQHHSISRVAVTMALETACRSTRLDMRAARLPRDPVAELNACRKVFRVALMTGRAPELPVAVAEPATPSPPAETAAEKPSGSRRKRLRRAAAAAEDNAALPPAVKEEDVVAAPTVADKPAETVDAPRFRPPREARPFGPPRPERANVGYSALKERFGSMAASARTAAGNKGLRKPQWLPIAAFG